MVIKENSLDLNEKPKLIWIASWTDKPMENFGFITCNTKMGWTVTTPENSRRSSVAVPWNVAPSHRSVVLSVLKIHNDGDILHLQALDYIGAVQPQKPRRRGRPPLDQELAHECALSRWHFEVRIKEDVTENKYFDNFPS